MKTVLEITEVNFYQILKFADSYACDFSQKKSSKCDPVWVQLSSAL